jgi:Holliday junction resolvase RusA-like endonuclease
MVAFVARVTPRSVNARSAGRYKERLQDEYVRSVRAAGRLTGTLYARVYYFCAGRRSIDADNLSKPVLDALIGHAYADDGAVVFRACAAVETRGLGLHELDVTDVPAHALSELVEALDEKADVLYIEIGTFHPGTMVFGGESDGS